jgi:hypothetical protein
MAVPTKITVPDCRRFSGKRSAALLFFAFLVNGFSGSWLMRMAYLPADHWWQRLAANVSPLAGFLILAPFAVFSLGSALLLAGRIAGSRGWFIAALILVVAIGVGSAPAGWRLQPGEAIRRAGLERIMANAEPVIEAIERYRTDTGEYPKSLTDLIPKYLAALPPTGNTIFSQFEYRPQGNDWIRKIPNYELFVRTPIGALNWDEFVYRPGHDYPDERSCVAVERVGDWAYLYE